MVLTKSVGRASTLRLAPGGYFVTVTTAGPRGGTQAPPRHFAFIIVN
jgi:hypothetical protein